MTAATQCCGHLNKPQDIIRKQPHDACLCCGCPPETTDDFGQEQRVKLKLLEFLFCHPLVCDRLFSTSVKQLAFWLHRDLHYFDIVRIQLTSEGCDQIAQVFLNTEKAAEIPYKKARCCFIIN